jgi:hypothetical protein
MRRRRFIAGLGSAAAWPVVARAPQRERGALMDFPESDPLGQARVAAFAHGMERLGWVDGKNIRIDYRF